MSTSSESDSPASELDLDLHFLPAWAQKPSTENKYAKFEGEDARSARRGAGGHTDRRGPRPPRRDQPSGPPAADFKGRREGGRRPFRGGGRPPEKREQAPPLEIQISLIPDERGVESLARQIRLTGRAYPLFDIAFLILKKPERYLVQFDIIKKADGQPAQPLFLCNLDDTLWLSENEAVSHVLAQHFSTFYQPERTPAEPPKGTYTFVAQCGLSGEILGPPNYHDYQNKLRKLHSERFARMPFDVYKSRVKIVKDEATVKKWLDEQSWKTEYVCLNLPEPLKLPNREAVEKHFRETHLPNIIRPVDSHTMTGAAAQDLPSATLRQAVRRAWEDQMRFPLRVVNVLSHQFAGQGLQFFKVNKTVTHVAVARPRYLDPQVTPVSDGVRRIIDFIQATPSCTRRKLLEALAPTPALAEAANPANQSETPPTPEVAALISDLHWLIHEGHVIEFASGIMEMARRPAPPRPAKAAPGPAAEESVVEAQSGSAEAAAAEKQAEETAEFVQPASNAAAPAAPAEEAADALPTEPASTPETAESAHPEPSETDEATKVENVTPNS